MTASDATSSLRYRASSAISGNQLGLQTSGGWNTSSLDHPRFFVGFLTEPEQAAQGLLAVAAVARARYHVPMTATRMGSILDPVVTSDGANLRFESFSACCGVYARFDITERDLDGEVLDRGTTNVDVNQPLQAALSRVRGREPLHLSVGPDALEVTTLDEAVVERKVPLPQRWLRGFAEAPVALARMTPRGEVTGTEARRFLRSLPRSDARSSLWATVTGRSLTLSTRAGRDSVPMSGPQRLLTLAPLLRFASTMRVYGPANDGSPAPSAWELVLPGSRLVLTLSPEVSRGFSGEGGVLEALADDTAVSDADLVADVMGWLPAMTLTEVGVAADLTTDRAEQALAVLGTAGRVGYDASGGCWFARDLPYDAGDAEALNPRLRSARRLVTEGRLRRDGDLIVVQVAGNQHHVRGGVGSGPPSCTCHWWARHRGGRGPCSHVLAARMANLLSAPQTA
ncbi:SWIM zinc finger family protein [Aquipuribacter hungaricus]|uniref:SWIM zinc finger family protein n=1 Tax=Aquipuribacter hungaricus TaxID=545624 RepID=A0ABV7WHD4_9MICO